MKLTTKPPKFAGWMDYSFIFKWFSPQIQYFLNVVIKKSLICGGFPRTQCPGDSPQRCEPTQAATSAHIFISSPFTSHQGVASLSLGPGTPDNCPRPSVHGRPQWWALNNVSSHTQPLNVLANVRIFSLLSVEHLALWPWAYKARVKEFLSLLLGNRNLSVSFGGFWNLF